MGDPLASLTTGAFFGVWAWWRGVAELRRHLPTVTGVLGGTNVSVQYHQLNRSLMGEDAVPGSRLDGPWYVVASVWTKTLRVISTWWFRADTHEWSGPPAEIPWKERRIKYGHNVRVWGTPMAGRTFFQSPLLLRKAAERFCGV